MPARASAIMSAIYDLPLYVKVISTVVVVVATLAAGSGAVRNVLSVSPKLDQHIAQEDSVLTEARTQTHLMRQLVCVSTHVSQQDKIDCLEVP